MFRLHGFPSSNYVNMVHLALLEKGLPFEYVMTYPNQEAAFLAKSPRGKVPFLESSDGIVSESSAILEYIEEMAPGSPLMPADPFARAQVRSLMKEIELYIELPARSCYPELLFGLKLPDAYKAKAREDLRNGLAALKRHGRFSPYLAGDALTLADIVYLYTIELAVQVAKQLFEIDLLEDFASAQNLLQSLNQRPHVQHIATQREANWPIFLSGVRAKYQTK